MPKVAVVSDSSCCLPTDMRKELGVTIVPISVQIDRAVFKDGSVDAENLFELAATARTFPTTAAPSPGAFAAAFRSAAKTAESVLCITLSSRISGTFDAAVKAAEVVRMDLPDLQLHVMDSRSLAIAEGYVVRSAARAAVQGADLPAAVATAAGMIDRVHLVGAIDTMRYLAKSGRVPWVVHWVSSALQIKPVLVARQDGIRVLARVRTRKKAVEKLIMYARRVLVPGQVAYMAVMHSVAREEAETLAERLRRDFDLGELLVTEFTPVMGLHTGPGFLGLAFYSEGSGGNTERKV